MILRPNRLQEALAEGDTAIGHMILEFGTRGIAQMLEVAGVDFTMIDMEHAGFSMADVADMISWFKATEVTPLVRVPQAKYHFIARLMDLGAMGVMVPNVKDAAQAQNIVDAVKYAPLGDRGVGIGLANTDFRTVDPEAYMKEANASTTVIAMIESREGLDNLEDIATTPGVDVLWVGHFDLTQSMGIPGQFQHEEFLEGLELVVDTAREYDLGAAIQPGSVAQAEEWMEMGFNVISYSGDVFLFIDALSSAVSQVREIAAKE